MSVDIPPSRVNRPPTGPTTRDRLSNLRQETSERLPATPDRQIAEVRAAVRTETENAIGGKLSVEVERARNRFGLSSKDYHNEIMFTPPTDGKWGTEVVGKHRMRAHMLRDGQPHPIYFVINGNGQPLYDPGPKDPQNMMHGTRYTYEQLVAKGDCHVVHLRVGNILSGNTKLSAPVTLAHMRNIMEDAFGGAGVFEGAKISAANFIGYSHGAGMIDRLLYDKESPIPKNVPIDSTVYLDGITYRSISALKRRPARSKKHMQFWQKNWGGHSVFIMGGASANSRPGDRGVNLTSKTKGMSHTKIAFAQEEPVRQQIYQPLLEFVHPNAAPASPTQPAQPTNRRTARPPEPRLAA